MRKTVLLGLAILGLSAAMGFAQDAAAPAASQPAEYTLTTPRATQLKTTSYVYQSVQTTLRTLNDPIQKIMNDMMTKIKAGQFMPNSGPILIFKTPVRGQDDPITMEIGMPTDAKTAPEGYQVRDLTAESVVTSVFQGPASALSKAYPKFFQQLMESGQMPSGELRERILYWESDNSPNNVMILEVGVQAKTP